MGRVMDFVWDSTKSSAPAVSTTYKYSAAQPIDFTDASYPFDSCVYATFTIQTRTLLRLRQNVVSQYKKKFYPRGGDQFEILKNELNNFPHLVHAIMTDRYELDDSVTSDEYAQRLYHSTLKDSDLWQSIKRFHVGSGNVIFCLRDSEKSNLYMPVQHAAMRCATLEINSCPFFSENMGIAGEFMAGQLLSRIQPGFWNSSGKMLWPEATEIGVTCDFIRYRDKNTDPFKGRICGIVEVKTTQLNNSRFGCRPKSAQRWIELTRKATQRRELLTKRTNALTKVPCKFGWVNEQVYKNIVDDIHSSIEWRAVVPANDLKYSTIESNEQVMDGIIFTSLTKENTTIKPLTSKIGRQLMSEMMTIATKTDEDKVEGVLMLINLKQPV